MLLHRSERLLARFVCCGRKTERKKSSRDSVLPLCLLHRIMCCLCLRTKCRENCDNKKEE